jgi:hypothetical protein
MERFPWSAKIKLSTQKYFSRINNVRVKCLDNFEKRDHTLTIISVQIGISERKKKKEKEIFPRMKT